MAGDSCDRARPDATGPWGGPGRSTTDPETARGRAMAAGADPGRSARRCDRTADPRDPCVERREASTGRTGGRPAGRRLAPADVLARVAQTRCGGRRTRSGPVVPPARSAARPTGGASRRLGRFSTRLGRCFEDLFRGSPGVHTERTGHGRFARVEHPSPFGHACHRIATHGRNFSLVRGCNRGAWGATALSLFTHPPCDRPNWAFASATPRRRSSSGRRG